MTGPKPNGPSHPRPTHPPKGSGDASILPTIGMVIRDSERLGAQLLAILNRAVDPASLPPAGLDFSRLEILREVAGWHAHQVLNHLAEMAAVPGPPVGSAVKLPARQDPEALPRASSVATTGEPVGPGGPSAPVAARIELGYLGPGMSVDEAGRYAAEALDPLKRNGRWPT